MRLTEVDLHREYGKRAPIILIDDFSSELDARRRGHLLNFLCEGGSQIFLSTTEELRLGKVFEVSAGQIAPLNGDEGRWIRHEQI